MSGSVRRIDIRISDHTNLSCMRARIGQGSAALLFHLCTLVLCALVATGGDGDSVVEECRLAYDSVSGSGGESGPAERAAALVALGDELMREGKPDHAVGCYKLACSLEEASGDAAGWRSLLLLGEALESSGKRDEALIAFRNATQRTAGFSRGEMASHWILTRCAHARHFSHVHIFREIQSVQKGSRCARESRFALVTLAFGGNGNGSPIILV